MLFWFFRFFLANIFFKRFFRVFLFMMDSLNDVGSNGTHLAIVIDVLLKQNFDSDFFQQCLDSILSLCSCFQLQSAANKVTIIGSNTVKNSILYFDPKSLLSAEQFKVYGQQNERVAFIADSFSKKFVEWIGLCESQASSATQNSMLSGALSQALCLLNRFKDGYKTSRIVIFSLGTDNPNYYSAQYMRLINCFFAAQKSNIMIDACSLALNKEKEEMSSISASLEDRFAASILQQGCDLTEGRYIRVFKVATLLEHLFWCLIPNSEDRDQMILPPKLKIAPPAACFCHRKALDIGYVCSVCVSIFCQYSPYCRTCNSNVLKSELRQIVNIIRQPDANEPELF